MTVFLGQFATIFPAHNVHGRSRPAELFNRSLLALLLLDIPELFNDAPAVAGVNQISYTLKRVRVTVFVKISSHTVSFVFLSVWQLHDQRPSQTSTWKIPASRAKMP